MTLNSAANWVFPGGQSNFRRFGLTSWSDNTFMPLAGIAFPRILSANLPCVNSFVPPTDTRFSTRIEPSGNCCIRLFDDSRTTTVITIAVVPITKDAVVTAITVFVFVHAMKCKAPIQGYSCTYVMSCAHGASLGSLSAKNTGQV